MNEETPPITLATEVLEAAGVAFSKHFCACEEKFSTEVCAKELDVDEHALVKTIVIEADGKPLIVLMHGDMRASAKQLADATGAKNIVPCLSDRAETYTGYRSGETSPFGTRTEIPVYMEETILNLRKIYVGGGKRGYLVGMDPYDV